MPNEEVVVIRLEGLGTFALPVAELRRYGVPEMAEEHDVVAYSATAAAVPVILTEDFLRGCTSGRHELVVDRFGAVSRPGHPEVLEGRA